MKTWHGILQSKNIKTTYDSRILGHPQHQNVLQKNEIISYYTHGIFFDINCYHLKSSKKEINVQNALEFWQLEERQSLTVFIFGIDL